MSRIRAMLLWLATPWRLWTAVVFYTVIVGLWIQLVLLPHVIPAMHVGHGLIAGVDGLRFHRAALALAEQISRDGWSAWTPKPDRQFVSGIAAIFYVLIYPEPWSVLPLNGVLHATAAVTLFAIMSCLTRERVTSLLASLPLTLFPSSLLWTAQFHNENYAVPGSLLILYGWVSLLRPEPEGSVSGRSEWIKGAFSVLIGSMLLGLVRLYALEAMTGAALLCAGFLIVLWMLQRARLNTLPLRAAVLLTALSVMAFSIQALRPPPKDEEAKVSLAPSDTKPYAGTDNPQKAPRWSRSAWLPSTFDDQLRLIAGQRGATLSLVLPGDTSVDSSVQFHSALDVLAYLPRAMQIGFLAPFPDAWFTVSRKESGTAMRAVSAFEMAFTYVAFVGLVLFMVSERRPAGCWFILFVCAVMIVLYGLTVINVGALYRFRYPYLMLLVACGVAGWTKFGGGHWRPEAGPRP